MECNLPEGEGGKSSTAQELHSAITRAQTNSPRKEPYLPGKPRTSQVRPYLQVRAYLQVSGGPKKTPYLQVRGLPPGKWTYFQVSPPYFK